MNDPLLSIEDTQRQLGGISRSYVYRLIAEGELDTIKLGTTRKVLPESVRGLIERRRAEAVQGAA